MEDPVAELVRRARALSPEDRERLVDQLLESLDQAAAASLDPSWETEIARRVEELDSGRVQPLDAAEVFANARRLLR